MEMMSFGVQFENTNDEEICIKFYSKEKIHLLIVRIKIFFDTNKYSDSNIDCYDIEINNNEKICTFKYPNRNIRNLYRSIGFVVKDQTNKKQYSINVPFDGSNLNIKKMNYGD